MKTLHRYPTRVTDIADEQFWKAIRLPKQRAGVDHLREAVQLGKAGQKAKAMRKLAAYHEVALADEWAHIQQEAEAAPEPDPKQVNDLLNHRIRAWHNQVVDFGPKIDWFPNELLASDSISGFNYFPWFRPAINAYIRSGDKEIAAFIERVILSYYAVRKDKRWNAETGRRSPKSYVFNQLGIGARTPHFVAAYLALMHHGHLTPTLTEAFAKQFLGFGRAIKPQNPTFNAHNIQTHGCRVLLQISRLFPEFREASKWDAWACDMLYKQIAEGFFSDGCHRERVWGYGSHTLQSLSEVYELGQRTGGLGKHDAAFRRVIRNSYRFYAKSAGPKPDMMMPTFGDAGVSSVKPILRRGERFFPETNDPCLGVDREKSYLLKPSGFAIMRNGDDKDSTFINLNFGQFAGWHSHQDLLSMNVWSQGQTLLEEHCRFGPYGIPLDQLFRAPEAHNLLTIDGMVYNCQTCRGENVAWHSDDKVDYFSATHRAYYYFVYGRDGEGGRTSPNIEGLVRRTVVLVKDAGYTLVLDSVTNLSQPDRFNRAITQHWHSPFPFKQLSPTLARTRGKAAIALAWAHADGLTRLETGADFTREECDRFGQAYDRHHLRARRWMDLDHTGIVGFATVLYPFSGKMPDVSVRALDPSPDAQWRAETYEIKTPAGRDLIGLNPEQRDGFSFDGTRSTAKAEIKLGNRRGRITVS